MGRFWLVFLGILAVAGLGQAFSFERLPVCEDSHTYDVRLLQEALRELGFFSHTVDGAYGALTGAAVEAFQAAYGLDIDGVVGPATQAELRRLLEMDLNHYRVQPGDSLWAIAHRHRTTVNEILRLNSIADPGKIRPGQVLRLGRPVRGELTSWTEINRLFPVGTIAMVIDVETGLRFRIRRRGGQLHADCEPLTRTDTQIMKEIYGGVWSWDRRAIVVQREGESWAASMNGMPHGGQFLTANGYGGHFCIHFLGSKLHLSGLADPEHQEMVRVAGMP